MSEGQTLDLALDVDWRPAAPAHAYLQGWHKFARSDHCYALPVPVYHSNITQRSVRVRACDDILHKKGSEPMVESPSPRLMRMPEVAAHLGVSRTTVYRLAERGQLPGVIRLGASLRIDRRALEAWIDRRALPSLGE